MSSDTFRNPVETSPMKVPLGCIDFDAEGNRIGNRCRQQQESASPGSQLAACPGKCAPGAFLYPRSKREDGTIHYHQGIDLTPENAQQGPQSPKLSDWREKHGVRIRAVTGGIVKHVFNEATNKDPATSTSYGNVVVIYDDDDTKLYFLYGHCHRILVANNTRVLEGEAIAIVGRTGIKTNSILDHLHFEVSKSKLPRGKGAAHETQLGGPEGPRLDPLRILEMLGPWGIQQTYSPDGKKIDQAAVDTRNASLARRFEGQFPLGINNLWHGGLHLATPPGVVLHAPFDGEIIAFRLDAEAKNTYRTFGSTNFILMRHEIADSVLRYMQGNAAKGPSGGKAKEKENGVGPVSRCTNDPDHVRTVKQDLKRHGYYDPAPGALESPTVADILEPIKAFQRAELGRKKPDGIVHIGEDTWNALRIGAVDNTASSDDEKSTDDPQQAEEDNEPDPARTIYSLYMHVGALPVNDDTASEFPWLYDVRLEPEPAPAPEPQMDTTDDPDAEHQADVEESQQPLRGSKIGPAAWAEEAVDPEDVRWVQKRLLRLFPEHYSGGVTGTYDETTTAGVTAVQNQHHPRHRAKKDGPGYVLRGGTTEKILRKTKRDIQKGDVGPASQGPTLDPKLAEHLASRDEKGQSPVVANLRIRVQGGQRLWLTSDPPPAPPDANAPLRSDFHWEFFSSEPLLGDAWQKLEDDAGDVAAPKKLIEMAEEYDDGVLFRKDGRVSPVELQAFYASNRAVPLRRTQVYFRSEWGWNVDEVVSHLEALELDTTDYADSVAPYQWWPEVFGEDDDALTWHYHPIEFLGYYQATLDALKSASRTAERDPKDFGQLDVRVLSRDGRPIAELVVHVHAADQGKPSATTDQDGVAHFPFVHGGPCSVTVEKSTTGEGAVTVIPEETAELEIQTELEVPRGTLRVRVRSKQGTDGKKLKNFPVVVRSTGTGEKFSGATNWDGCVDFGLEQGEYEVREDAADASETTTTPVTTFVAAGEKRDEVTLFQEVRLTVKVTHDGNPRDGVTVSILDGNAIAVQVGATESTERLRGAARFQLPAGTYTIVAGDAQPLSYRLGDKSEVTVRRDLRQDLGSGSAVGEPLVRAPI